MIERKRILIVHGYLHSIDRYECVKQYCESLGYTVSLFKMSGFDGESLGKFNYLRYQEIRLAIEIHLFNPDIIIGHSMGCGIILKALRRTESNAKIILINPIVTRLFKFPVQLNSKRVIPLFESIKKNSLLRKIVVKALSMDFDDYVSYEIKTADSRFSIRVLNELLCWTAINKCANDVTVYIGGRDRLMRKHQIDNIMKRCTNVEIVKLPDDNHTSIISKLYFWDKLMKRM